jgi:hypothetical protein
MDDRRSATTKTRSIRKRKRRRMKSIAGRCPNTADAKRRRSGEPNS